MPYLTTSLQKENRVVNVPKENDGMRDFHKLTLVMEKLN